MSQPLISVVIPTYNVEHFIEEAIYSIMSQTYRNLEIIIVDDASTDNTYQVIKELAEIDHRIKLFRNDRNKRIVETLNYGIEQATGSLIARMDGDDVSMPTKIESQYNFLVKNPEIDLVGVNVIVIDEQGLTIHNEKYPTDFESIKEASRFVSPVSHLWLTKASVYDAVGKYRIPSAEDLDFILRAIDQGFKLYNLPDYLYKVRMRQGNTGTVMGLEQLKSVAYIRKLHEERVKNSSITDSYSLETLRKALRTTWFERKRYNISSHFHFKYVVYKHKNSMISLLFIVLAFILSPIYQLGPIYKRWRYKKIMQKKIL
jgi:glycosyltransferase involved in cell wall biosynthesis